MHTYKLCNLFSDSHTGTSDPSSASFDDDEMIQATLLHDSVCSSLSLLFRFFFSFPYQRSVNVILVLDRLTHKERVWGY